MANPFDILPLNLFNLFITQGYVTLQRHYMAILLRLYSLAEFNRFGLAREVVIAEIMDYLRDAGANAEDEIKVEMANQATAEVDLVSPLQSGGVSTANPKSEQDYASFLIRRLEETGWIEREHHADYSETITLPDYAFTLLEALRKIQEQKPHDFPGQLYAAHQLITAADTNKDFSPALAVTQAYENVRQMVRGLSELNQNIRRYVERANPEWKSLTSEDILRELNLVANPNYIHLAGNWELTDNNGQIINLDSFTPSIGFPASQIAFIQKIAIRAESVLCIENLTSFHEFLRAQVSRNTLHATLCLMGNPSPAIRHILRLIPEETPIYLWADMDYGGFNILSQLRKQVSPYIQPYLMDIATFDAYAHLSRPLTQPDGRNLKRLTFNSNLKDAHPTIEHLLKRELKLEQEAIQI